MGQGGVPLLFLSRTLSYLEPVGNNDTLPQPEVQKAQSPAIFSSSSSFACRGATAAEVAARCQEVALILTDDCYTPTGTSC